MPELPGRPGMNQSRREKFLESMPEEIVLGAVPLEQPAAQSVARAVAAEDPPPAVEEPAPAVEVEPEPEDPPADDPPPAAAAAPRPAQPRAATRIQKSVELQRKADAAQRKAREANAKLQQTREATRKQVEAADRKLAGVDRKLADLESREAKLREDEVLAKTNPVRFMAKQGVTPAAAAAFARGETNPAILKAQQIEEATTGELAKIRQEIVEVRKQAKAEVRALENNLAEQQMTRAREDLLTLVYDNADQFEALSTIYSPAEIIEKAEELGEKMVKLQEDLDGDMLCERLEKIARKDPRWGRVQAKLKTANAPPARQPNAPPATRPNAPHTDEGEAAAAQRAPRTRPRVVDPALEHRTTPSEKHRQRVDRIASTTRITGIS